MQQLEDQINKVKYTNQNVIILRLRKIAFLVPIFTLIQYFRDKLKITKFQKII
jgi:hypothetical protein